MATKEKTRFVRPTAIQAPDNVKAKDIVVKDGDVINITLASGTKMQLVSADGNTTLKHGERETVFHEQYNEGVAQCTWPPMPEEVNELMGQLFTDGDLDDDQEDRENKLEAALSGK